MKKDILSGIRLLFSNKIPAVPPAHKNTQTRLSGPEAEAMAADFLRKKSFAIREQNYSVPSGEIDIVAVWRDVVVFVEVKYLSQASRYYPEEQVSPAKQRKIISAATSYMRDHPGLLHARFDVVAITAHPDGAYDIRHIEDAFHDES